MAELIDGKRYRLPNGYMVRANWDERRELWLLFRENDSSWWFIGQDDKLFGLLFGLSSLGSESQELDSPWTADQLEEVELSLGQSDVEAKETEKQIKQRDVDKEPELAQTAKPKPRSTAPTRKRASRQPKTRSKGQLRPLLIVTLAIVSLFFGVRYLIAGSGHQADSKESSVSQEQSALQQQAVGGPTALPSNKPILDLVPSVLRDQRDALSDEAWDHYLQQLQGQRIEWTGRVIDILPDGDVAVRVDNSKGVLNTVSAQFSLSSEELASIKPNARIRFQGDISAITDRMGPAVRLKNAMLVDS